MAIPWIIGAVVMTTVGAIIASDDDDDDREREARREARRIREQAEREERRAREAQTKREKEARKKQQKEAAVLAVDSLLRECEVNCSANQRDTIKSAARNDKQRCGLLLDSAFKDCSKIKSLSATITTTEDNLRQMERLMGVLEKGMK